MHYIYTFTHILAEESGFRVLLKDSLTLTLHGGAGIELGTLWKTFHVQKRFLYP